MLDGLPREQIPSVVSGDDRVYNHHHFIAHVDARHHNRQTLQLIMYMKPAPLANSYRQNPDQVEDQTE